MKNTKEHQPPKGGAAEGRRNEGEAGVGATGGQLSAMPGEGAAPGSGLFNIKSMQ